MSWLRSRSRSACMRRPRSETGIVRADKNKNNRICEVQQFKMGTSRLPESLGMPLTLGLQCVPLNIPSAMPSTKNGFTIIASSIISAAPANDDKIKTPVRQVVERRRRT